MDITSNQYNDARAHELRAAYHARFGGPELPVPVEAIAEDLLGLTVRDSESIGCSGMLIPARREIWINAFDHARDRRPRFTLAHEVGHWICHVVGKQSAPVYCRAEDVDPAADRSLEREANIFAAELLMPEDMIRAAWSRAPRVAAMASAFAVSPQAVQWRLYNFGLTDDRP